MKPHKVQLNITRKALMQSLVWLCVLMLLCLVGFWVYTEMSAYKPDMKQLTNAQIDQNVEIQNYSDHIYIQPKYAENLSAPLIFYPGGLVKPEAYLYKLVQISKISNKKVILVKPWFNLAFFNVNIVDNLIKTYNLKEVELAGHSLGGVAACWYTKDHQDQVSALYLYGSYCSDSISKFPGKVVSIKGKNDQIIGTTGYENGKSNLPQSAKVKEVEGMNHSAFGNYGLQSGDGEIDLTDEEVVELMLSR